MWWKLKAVPHYRQIDPIECGAVCLAMVLKYFGRDIDMTTLRTATGVSRNGAGAQELIAAAPQFGLVAHGKRILASELKTRDAPAILFFDNCHFVVFEGVRFNQFYINDPARGRYALDRTTFHRRYSKVAIVFAKGADFTSDQVTRVFPWRQCGSQLGAIILGVVMGLYFVGLANLASLLPKLAHDFGDYSTWAVVAAVLVLLGGLVLIHFQSARFFAWNAHRALRKESGEMVDALFTISPHFFADRPFHFVGRALASLPARAVDNALAIFTPLFFQSVLAIIILEVLQISAPIALLTIAAFAILWLNNRQRSHADHHQTTRAPHAVFSQLESLRAMGQSESIVDGLLRTMPKEDPIQFNAISLFMAPCLLTSVFLVAIHLWQMGDLPLAKIFELIFLMFGFLYASHRIFAVRVSKDDERISLSRQMTQFASPLRKQKKFLDNKIVELENVQFTYPSAAAALFHGINLSIEPSAIVGIVGAPQSGVSTLLRMLAGHISPTGGTLWFLDPPQRLPIRVAYVHEESDLVPGTLRDNVTLFAHNISDDDVVLALKYAEASDIFYQRPMGLVAKIAAHGANLSASEKTRLLIAQAIAHRPDLIVLDDAMSHLEDNVAKKILTTLRMLKIAVIFNSYSGDLLAQADRVLHLHNNTIHKIATHEQLHAGDANYRSLVTERSVEERFI